MLSQNQVVKVRNSIEKLYTHTCTIYGKGKTMNNDHSISFDDVILYENQPCRISFSSISSVNEDQHSYTKQQNIKLFIAPELSISEGSKVVVTHDDVTSTFSSSGVPALYPTHQEIDLIIHKDWA